MSGSPDWQSCQIYYYDEAKDALLLEGVQPLFQSIAGQVERRFFVRHWTHGPHLRLNFFCPSEQFADLVRPRIEARMGSYLAAHPSQKALDECEVRPTYEHLAQLEQEREPVLPLFPNNSLHYQPYDRRLHVLQSPLLADLLENFYCSTTELVFEMLANVRQGGNRLALSLDLLYTTAQTLSPHLLSGFLSYRSHAEGFLISCAQPAAMRALFEQKYQAQASMLHRRLRTLLRELEQPQGAFPFVNQWVEIIREFWQQTEPLVRAGTLHPMPAGVPETGGFTGLAREHLGDSDFHTQLESNAAYKRALYQNSWFQTYRLMLNMLYLHLNRLGVRSLERFLLCHLAANSVEEVFGVRATELLADPEQAGYELFKTYGDGTGGGLPWLNTKS